MTLRHSLLLVSITLLACSKPQQPAPKDNFTSTQIGQATDYTVSEISGMALSQINSTVLWVINDSGDGARIYALAHSGDLLTSIEINNADNVDWEDLAHFSYQGESHLLIADTGGNTSMRDVFDLYVIREPDMQNPPQSIDLQWRIRFRYEDEARDCEAVAVDAVQEKIILLSKRSVPAVLYELPLRPKNSDVLVAKRLGEVKTIPQPKPEEIVKRYDEYQSQPTGLDITPDGRKIAVLTYQHLFLYDRTKDEVLLDALNRTPLQIDYPPLKQAEAVCFALDNQSVLITSEHIPAPILNIIPASQ